jgi:hypothetical protein
MDSSVIGRLGQFIVRMDSLCNKNKFKVPVSLGGGIFSVYVDQQDLSEGINFCFERKKYPRKVGAEFQIINFLQKVVKIR